jgi:hypothetical protein
MCHPQHEADDDFSLAYSLALKMVTSYSSEALVDFQQTAWCYIPKDKTLDIHHYENPKSNT